MLSEDSILMCYLSEPPVESCFPLQINSVRCHTSGPHGVCRVCVAFFLSRIPSRVSVVAVLSITLHRGRHLFLFLLRVIPPIASRARFARELGDLFLELLDFAAQLGILVDVVELL